jgi:hypothetical protein
LSPAAPREPIAHPEKLLAACLAALTRAPEGTRRRTLYGTARGLARLVHAGHLEHPDTVARLVDAGRAAGQSDRDIDKAITAAFRAEGAAP